MKTLLGICIVALGILLGCGAGPTAPKETTGHRAAPTPGPTPSLCKPWPECRK